MFGAMLFVGCDEDTAIPKSVLQFQPNGFSVQNVTPTTTLERLAPALSEQSSGELSLDYTIIHTFSWSQHTKEEEEIEYERISLSLAEPTVSEVLKEIWKSSGWKYHIDEEGCLTIYDGFGPHGPDEQFTYTFSVPREYRKSIREIAATGNNDLKPLFIPVGLTFPPESYAYFVPQQDLIITKMAAPEYEILEAFFSSDSVRISEYLDGFQMTPRDQDDPFPQTGNKKTKAQQGEDDQATAAHPSKP